MKSSRRKAWTIRACCYGWSLGGTRMLISIEWFRLYYYRIMIKKLFTYVALVMSVFLLTACPSDDKEDDYNIDTSTSRLVGYWEIENYLNQKGISNTNTFVLFEEGKIWYEDNGKVKEGSWNYNKDTGLLATTAQWELDNWQWEITMIEDNEWAGFALWLDDKKTMLAKRKNSIRMVLLLNGTQWESDDYEIHCSNTKYHQTATGYVKGSTKADTQSFDLWNSQGDYDQNSDEVIGYLTKRAFPNEKMIISISHPFSLKKSFITISGYHPNFSPKNGVYKRVK